MTYKIVRGFFRGGRRTIARGLTLEQAQGHCRDPETSSTTCRSAAGKRRTRKLGPWFDGYERDGGVVARQTGGLRSTPINRAGGAA